MWDGRKYSLVVPGRPTLTLLARVGRPVTIHGRPTSSVGFPLKPATFQ